MQKQFSTCRAGQWPFWKLTFYYLPAIYLLFNFNAQASICTADISFDQMEQFPGVHNNSVSRSLYVSKRSFAVSVSREPQAITITTL